jgi:hypothetical protein
MAPGSTVGTNDSILSVRTSALAAIPVKQVLCPSNHFSQSPYPPPHTFTASPSLRVPASASPRPSSHAPPLPLARPCPRVTLSPRPRVGYPGFHVPCPKSKVQGPVIPFSPRVWKYGSNGVWMIRVTTSSLQHLDTSIKIFLTPVPSGHSRPQDAKKFFLFLPITNDR